MIEGAVMQIMMVMMVIVVVVQVQMMIGDRRRAAVMSVMVGV